MRSRSTLYEQPPDPVETADEPAPRRTRRRLIALAAASGMLVACGGDPAPDPTSPTEPLVKNTVGNQEIQTGRAEAEESTDTTEGLRNPDALARAEQIISTFENSTTEIQYAYVENLGDGRGITAGRSGFTSGTSDLLQVVETYAGLGNEDTPLAGYIPALEAVDGTGSVHGLDGFVDAWEEAIRESDDLEQAQDMVYKELYLDPALRWADEIEVKTALGQTILLDTIVQHGEGDDVDGFPSVVRETIDTAGEPLGQEIEWLRTFLDIREYHLNNAADPETRDVWRDSVDRVNALRSILDSGNLSLTPPISWTVYGDSFSIEE